MALVAGWPAEKLGGGGTLRSAGGASRFGPHLKWIKQEDNRQNNNTKERTDNQQDEHEKYASI